MRVCSAGGWWFGGGIKGTTSLEALFVGLHHASPLISDTQTSNADSRRQRLAPDVLFVVSLCLQVAIVVLAGSLGGGRERCLYLGGE